MHVHVLLNESRLKGADVKTVLVPAKPLNPPAVLPPPPDMPTNDDAIFGNKANGPKNKFNQFNQPQEESVEEAVL